MKYCSQCGEKVSLQIPENDNRERYVCQHCDTIHYQNPKIITGCLPIYQDKVLLCKRAIEPRVGYWTLPAGFMENNETLEQAAMRETHEEATATVTIDSLYTIFNLPHIHQVYIFFKSSLAKPDFSPGIESLDVQLFNENEIPWDNLAFPVVRVILEFYFEDRKSDFYPIRVEDILKRNPT